MESFDLNLRHLRAAAAIGRRGSISAAAKVVAISQPAITQGLSKLEAQIGQPLFDRRADGMTVTPAGALFLPRIEAALCYIASARVTMTQLRAFIALKEAGSYPGAAAATGRSQPSLHRAVGDLAITLKHPLVERRGKGINLTQRGHQIARIFRLACTELDAGISEVAQVSGKEVGRLAIGAMPLSRARILPAAVSAFHRHYSAVTIHIIEGSFHELIEPLRDGEIDLIVGALRSPSLVPDLACQRLFEDRPVVLGRSNHPASGGENTLQDLAAYPWILPARGTPLREQWEAMFISAGLGIPAAPINCGSVMAIRQILLSGNFLTVLSRDQVAVELEAGWLVKIADVPSGFSRSIGITARKDWRPTAMQGAFLRLIKSASGEAD